MSAAFGFGAGKFSAAGYEMRVTSTSPRFSIRFLFEYGDVRFELYDLESNSWVNVPLWLGRPLTAEEQKQNEPVWDYLARVEPIVVIAITNYLDHLTDLARSYSD